MRTLLSGLIAAAGAWLLAGCAATPAPPAPVVQAGAPVSCIDTGRIRATEVLDGRTIEFRMRDGSVYRNTLPRLCPGLGAERAFTYELVVPRLCDVDLIRVLRTSGGPMAGASCGLGRFVPVRPVDPHGPSPRP